MQDGVSTTAPVLSELPPLSLRAAELIDEETQRPTLRYFNAFDVLIAEVRRQEGSKGIAAVLVAALTPGARDGHLGPPKPR